MCSDRAAAVATRGPYRGRAVRPPLAGGVSKMRSEAQCLSPVAAEAVIPRNGPAAVQREVREASVPVVALVGLASQMRVRIPCSEQHHSRASPLNAFARQQLPACADIDDLRVGTIRICKQKAPDRSTRCAGRVRKRAGDIAANVEQGDRRRAVESDLAQSVPCSRPPRRIGLT